MALHELLILALVAVLAWAAVSDAMWFRIPNAVPIAIVALYPVYLLAGGPGLGVLHWSLAIMIGTFLLGALLFSRGWMGGGDVKLIAALALWAGPVHFPAFLVMTSIAGGALVLVILLASRNAALNWVVGSIRGALHLPVTPRTASGKSTVPYGIAIAIAGLHLCRQLHLAGAA